MFSSQGTSWSGLNYANRTVKCIIPSKFRVNVLRPLLPFPNSPHVPIFSWAAPHFLLNSPKRILNFFFLQFGVNVLNVFDSREIIATLSILRRFKRLDEQSLKRRNKAGMGRVDVGLSKIALLRYV